MCLAASETSYNCYCEGSDKPLRSNDMGNNYCPDNTLIAAYQNSLYIVGLPNADDVDTPIIHLKKINISNISAIIYNSIDGKSKNCVKESGNLENCTRFDSRFGISGVAKKFL